MSVGCVSGSEGSNCVQTGEGAALGRGRIICCNFDVSLQPAKDLSRATGDAFTLHCVEWLAAGQAAAATQPVEGL
jgi:hypothetical protein